MLMRFSRIFRLTFSVAENFFHAMTVTRHCWNAPSADLRTGRPGQWTATERGASDERAGHQTTPSHSIVDWAASLPESLTAAGRPTSPGNALWRIVRPIPHRTYNIGIRNETDKRPIRMFHHWTILEFRVNCYIGLHSDSQLVHAW